MVHDFLYASVCRNVYSICTHTLVGCPACHCNPYRILQVDGGFKFWKMVCIVCKRAGVCCSHTLTFIEHLLPPMSIYERLVYSSGPEE